jgi:proteasome lid subunit RPN8/RPN11
MSDTPEDVGVEIEAPAGGAQTLGPPRVFLAASARQAMNDHAASEVQHEIGGIMVGSVWEGPQPVVVIEDIIQGTKMSHSGASVTFTHDSWTEINQVKDERFADKKIVGWYHSHPGFGLFLSGHDTFIHRNFFSQPWHVAFVTDPKAGTCGLFTWQGNDLVRDHDYLTFEPADELPQPPAAQPVPAPEPQELLTCLAPEPRVRDTGMLWGLGLLAVLIAMLLGLALANFGTLSKLSAQVGKLQPAATQTVKPAATPDAAKTTPPAARPEKAQGTESANPKPTEPNTSEGKQPHGAGSEPPPGG